MKHFLTLQLFHCNFSTVSCQAQSNLADHIPGFKKEAGPGLRHRVLTKKVQNNSTEEVRRGSRKQTTICCSNASPPKSLDLKFGSSILLSGKRPSSVQSWLISCHVQCLHTCLWTFQIGAFSWCFFSSKDIRLKRQLLGPSSSYKYDWFDSFDTIINPKFECLQNTQFQLI